ncbi:MAG: hypothetical protein SOY73_15880 [Blautia sp.]|nr:hypothetical protein [Blautia sp.]MDY4000539.1 hypothetical protein [Blautia sp.]
MSSRTKIVVLHMREVIYTAIFLLLAIALGIILFFMFGPGKSQKTVSDANARYTPGVYRSSIELSGNTFDVEVTVDADRIKSIRLVNLSEATEAMFPLVKPALVSLASQIYSTQSLEGIQYSSDQKYTSQMLLNAIQDALEKAEAK